MSLLSLTNPNGCSLRPLNHERTFESSEHRTDVCRVGPVVVRSPGPGTYVRRAAQIVVRQDRRVVADTELSAKRKEILDFIADEQSRRGYPPSVREIGEAVGLTSSSTVHAHLATLQKLGYLRRDPTKPRAIEVRYDPESGAS